MPWIRITENYEYLHFDLEEVMPGESVPGDIEVDADQAARWQRVSEENAAVQSEMRAAYAANARRAQYERQMSDPVLQSCMARGGFSPGYEDEFATEYDWRRPLSDDLILIIQCGRDNGVLTARSRITGEILTEVSGPLDTLFQVAEEAARAHDVEPIARHSEALTLERLANRRAQLRQLEESGLELEGDEFADRVMIAHGFEPMMDPAAPVYAAMQLEDGWWLWLTCEDGVWALQAEGGAGDRARIGTGRLSSMLELATKWQPDHVERKATRRR